MGSNIPKTIIFFTMLLFTTPSFSQDDAVAAAPPPAADTCNGIFLTYTYTKGAKIPPTAANPKDQPYRFESTLTVLNNGAEELKSWKAFVGFQHMEILVSASNAVVADGGGGSSGLPASVENGTVFAGFPVSDLKSGIQTAGDLNQMRVQVVMVGTQFGVKPPAVPLPVTIALANDGFSCPKPTLKGKSLMEVCCTKDDKFKTNITVAEEFLPRQTGDLSIMYDVTRTYDSNYWAQVTIANHNALGRLDNWKLSFDWMRDEFIYSMKGALPHALDSSGCITGPQGTHYKDLDFANVMNCERRPTIVDLPPTKYNDSTIGLVPGCCRNGTILPLHMDPSKSISVFQMQVFKMPPNLNRSTLIPPQNWRINGSLNPDYKCGPPVRVSPSEYPDPSGLPSNRTAFASWQVVCNITQPKGSSPRCCVSFSAYYNESIIPCKTCACGCANTRQTCSTTASAMLLPPQALLVPFDNRTSMTLAWAELKHQRVPNPLPCGDNCGVNIHWHVSTDYRKGWSARITLFNWEDISFADWFAAVEMGKAGPGFEAMYSFNATTMGADNNTIFMQGLPDFNYLVAETDGPNPLKDPRVPGKQQSVISFTKKTIRDINVASRDGFPTKVLFNGEECSLPSIYPTSSGNRQHLSLFSLLIAIIVLIVLMITPL